MKSIRSHSFAKKQISTVIDFGMSWSHLSAFGHTFVGKCHTSQRLDLLFQKNTDALTISMVFQRLRSKNPTIKKISKNTSPQIQNSRDPKMQKTKGLESARGAPGPAAMHIPKVWFFVFWDLWIFGFGDLWAPYFGQAGRHSNTQ